mgnify:CR=1 FL=1
MNINQLIKERLNLLNNSNHDFKSIFEIIHKDKDFIFCEKTDGFKIKKTTYGQCYINSYKMGTYLKNLLNTDSEYVGLMMNNSLEFITALYGILMNDKKPVLLNIRLGNVLNNEIINTSIGKETDIINSLLYSDTFFFFVIIICSTQKKYKMAKLIAFLNLNLAPRITRHGVLMEVYGEGLLLMGESGMGKSETAIELLKRGHQLVADDAVEIRRINNMLIGTAPEIIRHYVELRGIGIVDVRRLFGMGAVKETERVDLVIQLENWVEGKMYDRLGLDEEKTEILGISLPSITIPVRPGRNLSIIIEVAAMNNRQKKMGYNTAEEFNKRLMSQMGIEE